MENNKAKTMKKRLMALLLCVAMMLNGSVSALASEVITENEVESLMKAAEEAHVHTKECYLFTKVSEDTICGKEVVEGHTHGDSCYEITNTQECICGVNETEGHGHVDTCFETIENLVCDKEHSHDDSCYTISSELNCGQEESEEHTHGDECYEESKEITCGKEHSHDGGCYETETKNVCGLEEVEAHTHGEECFKTVEVKTVTCELEEVESHAHGEECYEWNKELVCTIEASEPEMAAEVLVCEVCGKETCECKEVISEVHEGEASECEPAELVAEVSGTTVTLLGSEEAFDAEKTYALQVNKLGEETAAMVAAAIKEATRTANLEVLDYQAFDITLTADEEAAQPNAEVEVKFTGAKIEEYIAAEDAEVKAFYVDAEGNAEEVALAEGENEVAITTDHFSTYVVASVKSAEPVVLTTEVEGTTITLSGPISAFVEGKTYEITAAKVESEEELEVIEEALEEVAEEQEKVVESYQAFDIKIIEKDKTGAVTNENFQPLNETPVQVMFSGNEVAESVENEETETNVIHVDTETGETTDMAATATEEKDVEIETTHFSIYVVVDMGAPGKITLNIQHYAYLEMLEGVDGTDGLIIGGANNGLPNGVAGDGKADLNRTEPILTPIYATESKTLLNEAKRSLNELSRVLLADDIAGKDRYDLKELWVLKDNRNPESVGESDWEIYLRDPYGVGEDVWYLKVGKNQYDKLTTDKIELEKDTTIRMAYSPKEVINAETWKVTFFDYNVSTGIVTNGNYIMSTEEGINSSTNYDYTSFAQNSIAVGFDGHALNHPYNIRANKMPTGMNYVATTGMVLEDQGESVSLQNGPTFNGLYNPGLFSMEEKIGKKIITDHKLQFNRIGNTYILSSVINGADDEVASDLHTFREIFDRRDWNLNIYSNNFWPLDSYKYPASEPKDPLFGKEGETYYNKENTYSYIQYPSDDKEAHNWYFGMRYDFKFTIGDYTGPLKFYFRGDDDFWLFVDGKLKADIGGLHSSIGKLVDLEYLRDEDSKNKTLQEPHEVTIIFAERAGYGSTCYMEFTLPDAVPTTEQPIPTTSVTVNKEWIDGNNIDSTRPSNIEVELWRQGSDGSDKYVTKATISPNTDGVWTQTWNDLPTRDVDGSNVTYEYYAKEANVPNGYVSSVNGTTITNTLLTDIPVEKIWNDGDWYESRPESITVQLYSKDLGCDEFTPWTDSSGANKIINLTPDSDNNWKGVFENLPKYREDGSLIEYSVKELNGSVAVENNETVIINGIGYDVSYGSDENAFIITNTLILSTLRVLKVDSDNSNIKLSGAEFELKDSDNNIIETKTTDGTGTIVFENLRPGTYILTETKAPEGYSLDVNSYEITLPYVDNEEDNITVNDTGHKITVGDVVRYYEVTIEIGNEKLYVLPSTGGIGTDMFKISGLALMSGAALFLHKKKEDEEVQG